MERDPTTDNDALCVTALRMFKGEIARMSETFDGLAIAYPTHQADIAAASEQLAWLNERIDHYLSILRIEQRRDEGG